MLWPLYSSWTLSCTAWKPKRKVRCWRQMGEHLTHSHIRWLSVWVHDGLKLWPRKGQMDGKGNSRSMIWILRREYFEGIFPKIVCCLCVWSSSCKSRKIPRLSCPQTLLALLPAPFQVLPQIPAWKSKSKAGVPLQSQMDEKGHLTILIASLSSLQSQDGPM